VREARGRPRLGQGEEEPVNADAESDPGRGPATEQFHEPVIPPAATDRLLLAFAPRDVELERRPGVVVEAADQPGSSR